VGEPFELKFDWRTGTFQGPQVAMFCFHTGGEPAGYVDIDWFRFSDKP
jgi:hypothetical protein